MRFDRSIGLCFGRFDLFHQHVFGQRQHHRAGAAGGGDGKGAGDEFGDAARIVDLTHPFGEFGEGAAIFHFLKRLALTRFALNLTDEEDHRNGILPCDVQARRGIGGARSAGHHADAGFTRQPAPCVGHHGGAAFLAADHGFDAAFIKRIQHGEIAFARNAGNARDAIGLQRFDDQLPACSFHSGCSHGVVVLSMFSSSASTCA